MYTRRTYMNKERHESIVENIQEKMASWLHGLHLQYKTGSMLKKAELI